MALIFQLSATFKQLHCNWPLVKLKKLQKMFLIFLLVDILHWNCNGDTQVCDMTCLISQFLQNTDVFRWTGRTEFGSLQYPKIHSSMIMLRHRKKKKVRFISCESYNYRTADGNVILSSLCTWQICHMLLIYCRLFCSQ